MDYDKYINDPTLHTAFVNAHMALMVSTGKKFEEDYTAGDISRVIANMAHVAMDRGFDLQEVMASAAVLFKKESDDAAQKLTGGARAR